MLFLGHAADRTGPPIYLLHFLRWLRSSRPRVEFEVALRAGGPLLPEFRQLARTTIADGWISQPWWRPAETWVLRRRPELATWWWETRRACELIRQLEHLEGHALVYVNTAASVELARHLPSADRVQLSHVHELDIGLRYHLRACDHRQLISGAHHLFAASEAVRSNLIANHGVGPDAVTRHYEMVDTRRLRPGPAGEARRAARAERGLAPDDVLIGSGGTIDWRKAVDLFLRLAWELRRRPLGRPVSFVWVGGSVGQVAEAEAEAEAFGVDDVVRFVGLQADPLSWFELLDVFVLPAREDAFPLVCLEAASVGCPIVCFDNGGMPELVEQGCGFVARYPDVGDLADKVEALVDDDGLRRSLGRAGTELVREHHDVAVLAPRLWADIERWLP